MKVKNTSLLGHNQSSVTLENRLAFPQQDELQHTTLGSTYGAAE
jgi:hypothetical protein